MITFDMRERPPRPGDDGIFQLDSKNMAYMMVDVYSNVSDKGDDRLIMIDSLGRFRDANEYVAWIPSGKLLKLSKSDKSLGLDRLDEIVPADTDTTCPVVFFSNYPQEEGFRSFLEADITRSRIHFNASLVAALDYHHGDEIDAMRAEGLNEHDVSELVTAFLGENFDYVCQIKLLEPNA